MSLPSGVAASDLLPTGITPITLQHLSTAEPNLLLPTEIIPVTVQHLSTAELNLLLPTEIIPVTVQHLSTAEPNFLLPTGITTITPITLQQILTVIPTFLPTGIGFITEQIPTAVLTFLPTDISATGVSTVLVAGSTVDGTTVLNHGISTITVATQFTSSVDTSPFSVGTSPSSVADNGGVNAGNKPPASTQHGNTTTIIAIAVPVCVVFVLAFPIAWFWYRKRSKSGHQRNSRIVGFLSRKGTRKTSATGVEVEGMDKKELDNTVRPQELPGTNSGKREARSQASKRDYHAHVYANELEAASTSGTSRNASRKQRRDMQQQQLKQQAESELVTPREYNQFEANIMASMITQAEIDDELKTLRIEQGRIQAERETAEQKEAEIRRLIRLKEESGRGPSGDTGSKP